MKKQLLIGAMLFGSLFTAKAQETIFNVDFSSIEVLEDWFLVNADGDANNWGVNTTAVDDATAAGFSGGFAFSRSWNQVPLTPDNSLISQAFTVPTEGAYTTFKVGAIDPEFFAEHYAVYVITEEDFAPVIEGMQATPPTATAADFIAILGTASIEETLETHMAVSKFIDLAAYAGQEIRLVFRHFNVSDELIIILDDVVVTTGELGTSNNALASQFSVYPNPANNVINIANAENILVNAVSIVDINGRTVKSVKFDNVASAQINISDLATGVYMMNISSDKGTTTKKIVKN